MAEPTIPERFCACGCGTSVCDYSTWARGHNHKLRRRQRGPAPSCACGCGAATGWNRNTKCYGKWSAGHHFRIRPKVAPACQCGCGRHVKTWSQKEGWARYVNGHNSRVEPTRVGRGWHIDRDGYVWVYGAALRAQGYPGSVKRARVVLEADIGRRMVRGEEVHHKNRIKDDDRPENLQLVTCAEHHVIHSEERRQAWLRNNPNRRGR